jgi:hypothetical protein
MKNLSLLLLFSALVCSCSQAGGGDPEDEVAQAVGDTMASMDEAGGSLGTYAMVDELSAGRRTFARRFGESPSLAERLFPSAHATDCVTSPGFSGCTNNVVTRTFGGCTVLGATFTGTVTFTWSDAAVDGTCSMALAGHSVARAPNFTIAGRRGTFTASTVGTNGQVITKGAGSSFSFTNDGVRRVLTDQFGGTVTDFTSETTAAMTISGASRANRVLDGGTLRVTNNLTTVSCDFTPTDVTWTASCNCATSGAWTATCTEGKSATVTITGCGTGNLEYGGDTAAVTFDRCYGT